jgi:hypothetical protein
MIPELFPRGLEERIDYLRGRANSLILNWGEDTNTWEVSWITSGKRYTWTSTELGRAVYEVWRAAERERIKLTGMGLL